MTIQNFITECAHEMLVERRRGGPATRGVWYHGTNPRNLRSILSQGLKAVAPKNWDRDEHASRIQVDRTSYGGIYVTTNMMTAISSATRGSNKGNKGGDLLVIMQLQGRSLTTDEDDFARSMAEVPMEGVRWGARAAAMLWFGMSNMDAPKDIDVEGKSRREINDLLRRQDNKEMVEETWETYRDRFYEDYERRYSVKVPDQKRKAAEPFIRAAFEGAIERMAGYFPEEYGKWWKSDWHREYNGKVDPDATEENLPKPPDPKDGEQKFRNAVDKLTKLFKEPVMDKGPWVTARSLTDVKFSGANKIIAVVHIDRKPKPNVVTVHYGKLPDDFFNQWHERWGSKIYVQDKAGKRLSEYDGKPGVVEDRSVEESMLSEGVIAIESIRLQDEIDPLEEFIEDENPSIEMRMEDGDTVQRVVWSDTKPTQLKTNELNNVGVHSSKVPGVYGVHVTSEPEFWVWRLDRDYGHDPEEAWLVDIECRDGEILVPDDQQMQPADDDGPGPFDDDEELDPDDFDSEDEYLAAKEEAEREAEWDNLYPNSTMGDSNVLLTKRKVLKVGEDFKVVGRFDLGKKRFV